MKKLVLSLLIVICAFWSQSQISFKGISPKAVVGSYEFTYTSDPNYSEPWGANLSTPGYYVEDTLMLVSDGLLTPSLVSINPNYANAGSTLNVTITGLNTNFIEGNATSAFFGFAQGSGTVINSLTVNSKTSVTANITIPQNSVNGKYDLGVSEYLDGKIILKNGFEIKNGTPSTAVSISSVNPIKATAGSTLDVTIIGTNTHFSQGNTTVNFGFNQGSSTVNSVTVSSPTQLIVNVTIPNNTDNLDYNISVENPTDGLITLNKGIKVTCELDKLVISPATGIRGSTFVVSITGKNTRFKTAIGTTLSFNFNDPYGAKVVSTLIASSDTKIVAKIKIPNNTKPGVYDVTVTNSLDGTLTLPNAFTVTSGIASDSLGCGDSGNDLTGKIAFLYRGDCYFYKKIKYAQDNGARAVVIVNNVNGSPIGMRGGTSSENELITIPAIQISNVDGAMFRKEMTKGPVVAIMGNLNGYYQDNLSLDNNNVYIPKSYATPYLTVQDSTEMIIPLGATIFNRGSRTATAASLTVEIKQGNEILFTSTTPPVSILKDTLADFNFPDYLLSKFSVGKYSVTYKANLEGIQDLYLDDNTLTREFEITDSIFSLVPLNEKGIPIVTEHQRSGNAGLTSFMQCIKYENKNADRIGAIGMYFSATVDTLTMDGEEFNIQVFKWDDIFTTSLSNFSDNFLQLNEINSTVYNMEGDLQDTVLYVPFKKSVAFENDTKYLFCVTPTTNYRILLGYNSVIDYGLNDYVFTELSHPMRSTTTIDTWYRGFSKNLVPAFAIKTGDIRFLGSSEINKIEGSIYPNPTNDAVTISLNTEGVAKLVVTDIMGKVVMNKSINLTNGNARVDINSIESGMYIFNIILENGTSSQFNIVKN